MFSKANQHEQLASFFTHPVATCHRSPGGLARKFWHPGVRSSLEEWYAHPSSGPGSRAVSGPR
eukprot:8401071-Lingulodinium_polyedra.AAC.1